VSEENSKMAEWLASANRGTLPSNERMTRTREAILRAAATPGSSGTGGAPAPVTAVMAAVGVATAIALGFSLLTSAEPGTAPRPRALPRAPLAPVGAPFERPGPSNDALFAPRVEPRIEPSPERAIAIERGRRSVEPRLRDETQLIGAALEALHASRLDRARALLDEHALRYPRGALARERELARARLAEHETP
jgi:hypothetical protein